MTYGTGNGLAPVVLVAPVTPVAIDSMTGAAIGIDYEHHEIHDGTHFYASGFQTIALNVTTKWTVEVPDTLIVPHMTFEFVGSDGIQFEIYEGTTSISGGTAGAPFNSNRNSTTASILTVTKDPTSTNGSLIDSGSAGANNRIGLEKPWEKKGRPY